MRVGRFILAGLIIFAFSMPVFADEVVINTGTTLGCFSSTTCTPTSGSASWNPAGDNNTLTFSGFDTTSHTTSGGALDVKLGTFTWGGSAQNIGSSENFIATVIFTLPSGIVGGQNDTFAADIVGTVGNTYFDWHTWHWVTTPDTLWINFGNTPITLDFHNTNVTGSFQFYVDDVNLTELQCGTPSGDWYGHVTGASQTDPVPEPASMMLLATGLAGMTGAIRRKLQR